MNDFGDFDTQFDVNSLMQQAQEVLDDESGSRIEDETGLQLPYFGVVQVNTQYHPMLIGAADGEEENGYFYLSDPATRTDDPYENRLFFKNPRVLLVDSLTTMHNKKRVGARRMWKFNALGLRDQSDDVSGPDCSSSDGLMPRKFHWGKPMAHGDPRRPWPAKIGYTLDQDRLPNVEWVSVANAFDVCASCPFPHWINDNEPLVEGMNSKPLCQDAWTRVLFLLPQKAYIYHPEEKKLENRLEEIDYGHDTHGALVALQASSLTVHKSLNGVRETAKTKVKPIAGGGYASFEKFFEKYKKRTIAIPLREQMFQHIAAYSVDDSPDATTIPVSQLKTIGEAHEMGMKFAWVEVNTYRHALEGLPEFTGEMSSPVYPVHLIKQQASVQSSPYGVNTEFSEEPLAPNESYAFIKAKIRYAEEDMREQLMLTQFHLDEYGAVRAMLPAPKTHDDGLSADAPEADFEEI